MDTEELYFINPDILEEAHDVLRAMNTYAEKLARIRNILYKESLDMEHKLAYINAVVSLPQSSLVYLLDDTAFRSLLNGDYEVLQSIE